MFVLRRLVTWSLQVIDLYGPGGYRFTDFLRVGGPLQFLLAIVSTVGIAVLWGLH